MIHFIYSFYYFLSFSRFSYGSNPELYSAIKWLYYGCNYTIFTQIPDRMRCGDHHPGWENSLDSYKWRHRVSSQLHGKIHHLLFYINNNGVTIILFSSFGYSTNSYYVYTYCRRQSNSKILIITQCWITTLVYVY